MRSRVMHVCGLAVGDAVLDIVQYVQRVLPGGVAVDLVVVGFPYPLRVIGVLVLVGDRPILGHLVWLSLEERPWLGGHVDRRRMVERRRDGGVVELGSHRLNDVVFDAVEFIESSTGFFPVPPEVVGRSGLFFENPAYRVLVNP